MTSSTQNRTAVAAVLSGIAFAFMGAIQATHGDFGGTHNTLDSTAEYLVTGALAPALLLLAPLLNLLGRMAETPRAAKAVVAGPIAIGLMCVASVVNGEDPAVFNAVAPVALLTWLVSSIVIARGLVRTQALPKQVAIAIPVLMVATFALGHLGSGLIVGAFYAALGLQLHRGTLRRPALAA